METPKPKPIESLTDDELRGLLAECSSICTITGLEAVADELERRNITGGVIKDEMDAAVAKVHAWLKSDRLWRRA